MKIKLHFGVGDNWTAFVLDLKEEPEGSCTS